MSGVDRAAQQMKEKMKLSFSDYSIPTSEPEKKEAQSRPSRGKGRVDRLTLGNNKTYYLNLDKRDLKILNELYSRRTEAGGSVSRADLLSEALHVLYFQETALEDSE